MPVPSSYNDVTNNKTLRDFVGWAWYDRQFYVDKAWAVNRRVVLRIDSAHYYTIVVGIIGVYTGSYTSGHFI